MQLRVMCWECSLNADDRAAEVVFNLLQGYKHSTTPVGPTNVVI